MIVLELLELQAVGCQYVMSKHGVEMTDWPDLKIWSILAARYVQAAAELLAADSVQLSVLAQAAAVRAVMAQVAVSDDVRPVDLTVQLDDSQEHGQNCQG